MVQAPSLAAIEALRSSQSIEQQLASLKELKNNIIGHDQRKELVVKNGVIEPLVGILSATGRALEEQSWSQAHELKLQATIVLGTLANGGPAFVPPLLAAHIVRHLVDGLTPDMHPKLVTASLQALKNIVIAWQQATSIPDASITLDIGLYHNNSIAALLDIIGHSFSKQQKQLVADIISHSVKADHAEEALADLGILDALAGLLVAHSVAQGHGKYDGDAAELPSALPVAAIPSILSAITAIVEGSTLRTYQFLFSKHLRQLFPKPEQADLQQLFSARNGVSNGHGSLLPPLHIPTYKSVSFNGGSNAFPVLSSLQVDQNRLGALRLSGSMMPDFHHENAVTGWLMFFARSFSGHDRLIALRLLALVHNAIESNAGRSPVTQQYMQKIRERERQLALLAVPLAVKLVQDSSESKSDADDQRDANEVRENACAVLALLIKSSKELQASAVDAGAIKYVCPVLKKSFDNVALAKPMWSAKGAGTEQPDSPDTCKLGSKGLPPEIMHAMRCREGALEALAAIARREDIHRKAIVESGVVSCIIESLKPYPVGYAEKLATNRGQASPKDGNTTSVILAACHAAQSMSRSVSLLRTSLIDAGVAKPIFDLLSHSNPEVQIAATDVCCNLLMDFSPMREDLMAAGVVKTLCNHARRSSPALRLSSLWALKHLVMSSSREIKMSTLEELGTGWLVGAIEGEHRDTAPVSSSGGVSVGLSTANAAGEQVDLLNPSSMDVDDDHDDGDEELDEGDEDEEDEDGELMYDEPSNTHYQSSQLRSTLRPPVSAGYGDSKSYLDTFRRREQDPSLQAKRDDVAIQEQALDFVRNLLNGPDDCAFMLDHVLEQFGASKFFELLNAKFAPLPTAQRQAGSRPMYQPTELILSAVNVLTHVANGSAKQKQLLIAQKQLLQNFLPHFAHADRRVRVMCVWVVNSLTWIEEERDRSDARLRAR